MSSQKILSYQSGRGLVAAPPRRNRGKFWMIALFGVSSMAIGAACAFFAIKTLAPETPAPVKTAQPVVPDNEVIALDEAVTRALSVDLLSLSQPPQAQTVSVAIDQTACLQTVTDLAATARVGFTTQTPLPESAQLEQARQVARAAKGCNDLIVAVEGHASFKTDEVENLVSSWQQAENTIAALALEGLDVRAFRPLGFGSRNLAGETKDAQFVSFRIVPQAGRLAN